MEEKVQNIYFWNPDERKCVQTLNYCNNNCYLSFSTLAWTLREPRLHVCFFWKPSILFWVWHVSQLTEIFSWKTNDKNSLPVSSFGEKKYIRFQSTITCYFWPIETLPPELSYFIYRWRMAEKSYHGEVQANDKEKIITLRKANTYMQLSHVNLALAIWAKLIWNNEYEKEYIPWRIEWREVSKCKHNTL